MAPAKYNFPRRDVLLNDVAMFSSYNGLQSWVVPHIYSTLFCCGLTPLRLSESKQSKHGKTFMWP
jgi:hypothetical protein